MDVINITGTDDTPSVTMDKANAKFLIQGRSLPEDVTSFYGPVLEWIEAYGKDPNPDTEMVFKLEYFNTASSKVLLDVLLAFEGIKDNTNVTVKWCYREDEEDIKEAGEEYEDIVDLPFDYPECDDDWNEK